MIGRSFVRWHFGWVLLTFLVVTSASGAGRNEGGALIVHTDEAASYTSGVCAQFDAYDPGSCEAAGTRTDKDRNTPALVWLIAAFHPTMAPAVSLVAFGLQHNLEPGDGHFPHWGPCGPGSFEIPDLGWPESGGDVVYFEPAVEDTLFAFYLLDVYGNLTGSYLGTEIHPAHGRAYFLDDGNPAVEDVIERFGVVRWGADGANSCPAALPTGGCCLADMTCSVELERECLAMGGTYVGDGTTCAEPCGACCYWAEEYGQHVRRCTATTMTDCLDDARWDAIKVETDWGPVGAEWGSAGQPCIQDPEWLLLCRLISPVAHPTWGRFKALFR